MKLDERAVTWATVRFCSPVSSANSPLSCCSCWSRRPTCPMFAIWPGVAGYRLAAYGFARRLTQIPLGGVADLLDQRLTFALGYVAVTLTGLIIGRRLLQILGARRRRVRNRPRTRRPG